MIKLAIFDWNGTLLADTQACIDAGNEEIEAFGGKPLPRKEYIDTFDFPVVDFMVAQGCDREELLKPEVAEVFHTFYEPRALKCRTRRGAREILQWLKSNSIDSVILSNHIESAIEVQLERLGLVEYFKEILGNKRYTDTHTGNNKVQRMVNFLERTGYSSEQAIIVGDSPEDIGVGKRFGMKTVGITDGYFSTPRLRASNPDHLITSIYQVRDIVENL